MRLKKLKLHLHKFKNWTFSFFIWDGSMHIAFIVAKSMKTKGCSPQGVVLSTSEIIKRFLIQISKKLSISSKIKRLSKEMTKWDSQKVKILRLKMMQFQNKRNQMSWKSLSLYQLLMSIKFQTGEGPLHSFKSTWVKL